MTSINKIRAWLQRILGPTVPVDTYTDQYVVDVFRMVCGFYGSSIIEKWGAPGV